MPRDPLEPRSPRMLLAPTGLALGDAGLTFVPDLPLVPVRDLVAAALAADPRPTVWVDLPEAEPTAAAMLSHAVDASGTDAESLRSAIEAGGIHRLVVTAPPTLGAGIDSLLLRLLDAPASVQLVVIGAGRRPIESAARSMVDARVIAPSDLVLDADAIVAYAADHGLDLSAEGPALASTALALPHVLPMVVSAALSGAVAPVRASLESEAAFALASQLAMQPDAALAPLVPLVVPFLLTPSAVATADLGQRAGLVLPMIAAAGLLDPVENGFRLRLSLRSAVLPELERRFAAPIRALDARLGQRYRDEGEPIAAAVHFANAELFDDAVAVIDEHLLDLVALDRPGLNSLLQSLPRAVRDAHPRLMLAQEFGAARPTLPGPASLTVGRRASGLFGLVPADPAPLDALVLSLARTMVLRSRADMAGALAAARDLDRLLTSDALARAPLATIAEGHYQVGLTRLLAVDLLGARESFARAWESAAGLARDPIGTAIRAAGAVALVRALEGEAIEATLWLDRLHGGMLDTAGIVAHALVALGRPGPRDATHWLARVGSARPDDELWPFVLHATNRYGISWGDPVETEADLDRAWADHAEQLVEGTTARILLTADAADLALLLGHFSRAESLLKAHPERNAWLAASRARLALVSGSPQLALLAIHEGQGLARSERYAQLDLAVLRAAAELDLRRTADAAASVVRAINLAQKAGVVTPFRLLHHDAVAGLARVSPEAAEFFAQHELTGTSYLAPSLSVGRSLSERELVVLRALGPTVTVEQIAKQLFVATNTVKAQLRSIYRKLGVANRTEALLVAAEYGLLDDQRSA